MASAGFCAALLLVCWTGWVQGQDGILDFPSSVQNDPADPEDKWNFHTLVNGERVEIFFHGDNVTAVSAHFDSMGTVIWQGVCEDVEGEVGNEEEQIYYITPTDVESNSTLNATLCLTFHLRTKNVIQISTAKATTDGGGNVCGEMQLIEWPLIANKHNNVPEYHPCPIIGAFNMKQVASYEHPEKQESYCEGHPFRGLIESECTLGEYMKLSFPDKTCIPRNTGWAEEQSLICEDTWEVTADDNSTHVFSVMGDEASKSQFIIRSPKDFNGTGTVQIFQDMVSPLGEPANGTFYIALDIHMKTNEPCQDDVMITNCEAIKCSHSLYRSTCQETCQFCDEHPFGNCSFVDDANVELGDWVFDADYWQYDVKVTENQLLLNGNLSTNGHVLTCHTEQESDTYSAYKMKASTLNGCLPRYTCAKFNKVSPSVLQYKLSQMSRESIPANELCSDSNFQDDPPPFTNYIRSRNYNVLTSLDPDRTTVSCGFQGRYNFSADVMMLDAVMQCAGEINDYFNCTQQDSVNAAGSCDHVGGEQEFNSTFDCLGVLDFGSASTKALIVAGLDEHVACWILMDGMNPLQFYTLHSAQCDASTLDDIINQERQYTAYVEAYRVDECNGVPTTDHTPSTSVSTASTVTPTGPTVSPTSSTATGTDSTIAANSSTSQNPEEDVGGTSAGAVVGILFAVALAIVVVVGLGWFVYRLYLARKQPYRVL